MQSKGYDKNYLNLRCLYNNYCSKMGNCRCQDRSEGFEFIDNKQEVILPTKTQLNNLQPQVHTVNTIAPTSPKLIIPKPPSHAPQSVFAKPAQHFPQLSPRIKMIDQSLGEFKTSANLWTEDYRPVYLNQAYKLQNGAIYKGQWFKGNINGNGLYYFPDGSFLRGFSINNQVVGYARLIKQNGNYYQGSVAHNKANGDGVLFQNGVFYKGKFQNNFLQGIGTQYSSNYKFEGNYHNGAPISGKLTWDLDKNPPTVYEGGFFDEKFNGQGKLTNHIGEYKGSFQNGKKNGRGTFTWKNGQKFQGYYDSDLKNGQGRMFNAKGDVVLQGIWSNDKFKN